MNIKNSAVSFIRTLLIFLFIAMLLNSKSFAEHIGLSETLRDSIETFITGFISLRQTGENIAKLRIGKFTIKLDLDLLRSTENKLHEVIELATQCTPEFVISFFSELYSAVKEITTSILTLFGLSIIRH